jgi:hypothetical protein
MGGQDVSNNSFHDWRSFVVGIERLYGNVLISSLKLATWIKSKEKKNESAKSKMVRIHSVGLGGHIGGLLRARQANNQVHADQRANQRRSRNRIPGDCE